MREYFQAKQAQDKIEREGGRMKTAYNITNDETNTEKSYICEKKKQTKGLARDTEVSIFTNLHTKYSSQRMSIVNASSRIMRVLYIVYKP